MKKVITIFFLIFVCAMAAFAQSDTCVMGTIPFAQDFEDVEVGQLPYCWTYWNTYTSYEPSSKAQVSSLTARSGQHSLRFLIGGYINLPVLNSNIYTLQDMELRLWVSTANITMQSIYSVSISVGVMSNGSYLTHPSNSMTFQHDMEPGEFVLCTFHFDWLEEDADQIVIYVNNMFDDIFIDDLELIHEPCSQPQNLAVDNSIPGQALLKWDANQVGSAVNYVVAVENLDNYSWQQLTTTDTFLMLNNLEERSLYRATVSTYCGTSQTVYPDTITFLTRCINPTAMTVDPEAYSVNAMPFDLWSTLTYSQQLYLREELDTVPRTISAIAFKYIGVPASCRAIIYLAQVTDSILFSNFIQASDSVNFKLVFRHYVDWVNDPNNEWLVLNLDSTFEYDGSRNLLLVCYAHGYYNNIYGPFFMGHPAGQQCALCYNSNYGGWVNPLHPGSPNHYSMYRSNVKFIYCDENTCVQPVHFQVGEVDCKSVALTWTSGDSQWDLAYQVVGDSAWTLLPVYSSDYLLDNLQPNTNYLVKVRTNCGDTVSSWSDVRSFRTTCLIETLPYRQNFDDEAENIGGSLYLFCWDRMVGESGGLPYLAGQQNNFNQYYSSPYALMFPQGSLRALTVLPPITDTIEIADLRLSFMWKTSWGDVQYFEIGLMTDPSDPSTFFPIDTVRWHTGIGTPPYYYFCDFVDYYGEARYIAIRGTNQASFSTYNYIDDVELDYSRYCPRAVVRDIDLVTATTAQVKWDCDTSVYQWVLEYGPAGFTPGTGQLQSADANPYILTGLVPDTQYDVYVRFLCNEGDTGRYWKPGSFTTDICDDEDRCTIILSAGLSTSSSSPNTYMGKVDVISNGTVIRQFTMVSGHTEEVVLCDGKDIVLLWRENEQGTTADLAVLDADLDTLAFYPSCNHNTVGDTIYAAHLDCFHSSCPQPQDFTVYNIHPSSVDVTWNPDGNETAWTLRYRLLHTQEWTEMSATGNFLHLDSLVQNTWYEVWLRADCSDTLSSLWRKSMFRTNPCPNSCDMSFYLRDSYGDGWNGASLDVVINNTVVEQLTVDDTTITFDLSLCLSDVMQLVWHKGSYDYECGVVILNSEGDTLFNRNGFSAVTENQVVFTDTCYMFHSVTSSAGEGGTIDPAGVFEVMSGQSILFAIVPDSGFVIANIIVDGESVGTDAILELSHIIDNHTVYAEFEEDGIGVNEYLLSLKVFPVPATHTVTLEWKSGVEVLDVEVYDIYGNILRTIVGVNNNSPLSINISNLSPGMYFVRVSTDLGPITKPFVIK